ncbi:VOC family protein [Undibacterium sp. TJN25]|uniref:VOC family protein n=1 Tax=Undibacterium sp. TJN25 TaxID=3413056 RepID=UPI003BF2C163
MSFSTQAQTVLAAPMETGLCCIDIDALSGFYISAFSFKAVSLISVAGDVPGAQFFSDSGYRVARLQAPFGERLKLLAADGAAPAAHAGRSRPSANILKEANAMFITFIVADIAAALERAVTLGATAMGGITTIRSGLAIVLIRDPEGNCIELAQYNELGLYRPDLFSERLPT